MKALVHFQGSRFREISKFPNYVLAGEWLKELRKPKHGDTMIVYNYQFTKMLANSLEHVGLRNKSLKKSRETST